MLRFLISVFIFSFWVSQNLVAKELSIINRIDQEPLLEQVIQASLAKQKLSLQGLNQLHRRARKSAWLPKLYLGFDHSFRETSSVAISDNISVNTNGVVIGPTDSDWDQSLNQGSTLRVRAVWSLDELVYKNEELRITQQKYKVFQVRQKFIESLTKIYLQRKKFVIAWQKAPQSKKAIYLTQAQALTSLLNHYTQNQFASDWIF